MSEGDRLGDYRILDKLGEGGMGVVYLAQDEQLERKVALKLIAPQVANDEEFRRRFTAEAKAAAAIDSPHVVTIYSAGTIDDALYIAMRHVEGRDLGILLEEGGPLEPRTAVEVVSEVASGLDAAHARGVIHRDVKPGNILIEGSPGSGRAFLTDFGLIKHLSAQSKLTKTAQWLGTIDYVAPEQIQGGDVGPYTDVYALGCVLYEALTGEVPFDGDDLQKMWAHVHEPLPDPRQHGIDEPIAEAIQCATAKEPRERFSTAGDFARAIAAPARTKTGRAPLGPREAPTRAMSKPPRSVDAPPAPRPSRAPLIGAAAVIVAAGLLASALVVRGSGSSGNATTVVERTTREAAQTENEAAPEPSSSPEPTPSPEPEADASASGPGTGDWSAGSAYSALLGAFSTEASARTWQQRAIDHGLEAGVLYSSEFRSLRPGYWVVFSGAFETVNEADARATQAEALGFPGSYPKLVSP
jgi:serine/threonine-protein kinase